MTEQDLEQARTITKTILADVGNDRTKAMETIVELCKADREMQVLFAKVGYVMYESSKSSLH